MTEELTWHQKRAAKSRRAILDAARRLFLRTGYKTSMDAVCAESSVSPRTLYQHFSSKEQLFRAIIDDSSTRRIDPLLAILEISADPADCLERFATRFLELVLDPDVVSFLRLCVSEVDQFPDAAARHYVTGMNRILPAVADYLAAGMELGTIRREIPQLLAEQFITSVIGYRQYRALLAVPEQEGVIPPAAYIKGAVRSVLA